MHGNSSQCGNNAICKDFPADLQLGTRGWYFTKDEIDNHSPSRKDGIDRVRESSLRKSYCSFLKDLGMKLRVSPVTTATAMMFCHRFYMRQSLAKNDWQTVATACMFLASKVEDNLRPLRDVTLVAYEIIYKWDPSASERIKKREVYYKQKELILAAENLLLVTIAFDIGIKHPFRPLVDALKRLKISNNDVAKAAWNLLNEWLRTTLCLQYKPHYIAAASLSVAAKLLNFKLPMIDGKAWWLQFDVSPKQLEEVTQQMLRYFKHDEKQKVQVANNVMKPTLKVENCTSKSAQSSIMAGDVKEEPVPVASQEQKSYSCKYDQKVRAESNKVMVKAPSELDEKHNAQVLDVMKPTLRVENATSQSTQSSITVGSNPEEEAASLAGLYLKPHSFNNGQKSRAENNQITDKAVPEHQSSDSGSGISSVMDLESVDTSSKIAHVDDALSKIDVDRLKGAFQRTKRVKCDKNKLVALTESELDNDLLLENELEKGVEVEYVAAVKKQKVFHN